jgi:hypothetical protein
MGGEPAAVGSEQRHKGADIRAVLEGECAIHIGFAGVQLGVQKQLGVEPGIVQTDRDRRTGAEATELMQRTIGCDQAQLAVADKTVEQVSEQPHLQTSVSC